MRHKSNFGIFHDDFRDVNVCVCVLHIKPFSFYEQPSTSSTARVRADSSSLER